MTKEDVLKRGDDFLVVEEGGLTKRVTAAKESAETPISLARDGRTEIGGNGFFALGAL